MKHQQPCHVWSFLAPKGLFWTPLRTWLKDCKGQNCFKPTSYSQSKHIYGCEVWKPCYETLPSNCCHCSVSSRQFSSQGATCHRVGRVQDYCSSMKPFFFIYFKRLVCLCHLWWSSFSFTSAPFLLLQFVLLFSWTKASIWFPYLPLLVISIQVFHV